MSLGDLSKIGKSILASTLIPQNATREWLKPNAFTGTLYTAAGKPWEIYQMNVPVSPKSKQTRVIDLYSKGGSFGDFNSMLLLSPDHGIGIAVLTSKIPVITSIANLLTELMVVWIPGAEAAAREKAARNFAGTYRSNDGSNSTVTIDVRPDRMGLGVTKLVANGKDILLAMRLSLDIIGADLQFSGFQDDRRVVFRAIYEYSQDRSEKQGVVLGVCTAWKTVDLYKFGNFAVDEFIFNINDDGRAKSVILPAWRSGAWEKID